MRIKAFIVGLSLLFMSYCKGDNLSGPTPPTYPNIVSFEASPSTIKRGASSTLSWNSTNCTSASIDEGIGSVPCSGLVSVKPLDDTTYTLTAVNSDGQSSKSCSIKVEDGANVVMTSGPSWKEDKWTFTYFGKAKNAGTYKASFVKIYIYLNDENGKMVDYDYTYVDKTDLDPGEESPWSVSWWDDNDSLRNKFEKSQTEYEIEWSEYTFLVKTGRKSIFEQ